MIEELINRCEGHILSDEYDGKRYCRIGTHFCQYSSKSFTKLSERVSKKECLRDTLKKEYEKITLKELMVEVEKDNIGTVLINMDKNNNKVTVEYCKPSSDIIYKTKTYEIKK